MRHWRMMMMIFRDKWNHCSVQQTNSEVLLTSALLQWKNTLFLVYCMPMYACQLWSKCTQTTVVWSFYVLRITTQKFSLSTSPHQVNHCVRTFDALLRNNLYRFLYDAHLHLTFLFDRFKRLMLLTNILFPQLFNAPVWWRRTAIVVGALFRCSRLISIDFGSKTSVSAMCTNQAYKSKKCCPSVLLLMLVICRAVWKAVGPPKKIQMSPLISFLISRNNNFTKYCCSVRTPAILFRN